MFEFNLDNYRGNFSLTLKLISVIVEDSFYKGEEKELLEIKKNIENSIVQNLKIPLVEIFLKKEGKKVKGEIIIRNISPFKFELEEI